MTLIRHGQPVVTRVTPHNANRRFLKTKTTVAGGNPLAPKFIGPAINDVEFAENILISPFDFSVVFTGPDLVYSTLGTWPTGLVLSVGGLLTGTPTVPGLTAGLRVRVDNVHGAAQTNAFDVTITSAVAHSLSVTEVTPGACSYTGVETECTATGTYTATPTGYAPDTWVWSVTSGTATITLGQGTDTVTVESTASADNVFTLKCIANVGPTTAQDLTQFTQTHTDNTGPNTDFITVWRTTGPTETITLPATGTNNFTVDWGDLSAPEVVTTPSPTHEYAVAGDYQVSIEGSMPIFAFVNGGDKLKIIDVSNWGDVGATTMQNSLFGCLNMDVSATDLPGFSNVVSMQNMFFGSGITSLDISGWSLPLVTNMLQMFQETPDLVEFIANDMLLPELTTAKRMFFQGGATGLTISAKNWNVPLLTDVEEFGRESSAVTVDLSGWTAPALENALGLLMNISTITSANLAGMVGASVTTITNLLLGASSLTVLDISGWNTAGLLTAINSFSGCSGVDPDVSGWNVGALTGATNLMLNSAFGNANYDALLLAWSVQTLNSAVAFHAGNAQYTEAAARLVLTDPPNSWVITDGGAAP